MRPLRVHKAQDNGFSRNGIPVSQAMRRPDHKRHSLKKVGNSKIKTRKQADFFMACSTCRALRHIAFLHPLISSLQVTVNAGAAGPSKTAS